MTFRCAWANLHGQKKQDLQYISVSRDMCHEAVCKQRLNIPKQSSTIPAALELISLGNGLPDPVMLPHSEELFRWFSSSLVSPLTTAAFQISRSWAQTKRSLKRHSPGPSFPLMLTQMSEWCPNNPPSCSRKVISNLWGEAPYGDRRREEGWPLRAIRGRQHLPNHVNGPSLTSQK